MENIEIKLPSGVVATLKSYTTQLERRDLRAILLNNSEVSADGTTTKNLAKVTNEMEDAAIKLVVISLNGSTENVLERVLNLRTDDFDALKKEIDNTTSGQRFLA